MPHGGRSHLALGAGGFPCAVALRVPSSLWACVPGRGSLWLVLGASSRLTGDCGGAGGWPEHWGCLATAAAFPESFLLPGALPVPWLLMS